MRIPLWPFGFISYLLANKKKLFIFPQKLYIQDFLNFLQIIFIYITNGFSTRYHICLFRNIFVYFVERSIKKHVLYICI